MANRLSVTEHHSTENPSEVVRVDIDGGTSGKYSVIVEHLGSQNSVIVDIVYPDEVRFQIENIFVGAMNDDSSDT